MTKLIKGVNDLASVNPDLAEQWCQEKNCQMTPDQVPYGSHKIVWWKCKDCGYEYQASIHNRHFNKSGCPACFAKYAIIGINDLATKRPDLLDEWDYSKNPILPTNYTERSDKKVWWICKLCGHNWQTQIKYRSKGVKCPHCQKMYQSSFPENALLFYIRKAFPDTINRFKPDWLNNGEIDIFIPSHSVGIEYDGKHWHEKTAEKDTIKGKAIAEHNIALIRIREYGLSDLDDGSFQIHTDKPDSLGVYMEYPIRQVFSQLNYQPDSISIDILSDYSDILKNTRDGIIANSLATKRPDLLQEWDYDKNSNANPKAFSVFSGFKVWWICSKCGNNFQMTISNRNAGHGCPKCGILTKPQCKTTKNMIIGQNDLCSIHPELLEEWDYDKNDANPKDFTIGSAKKVWWKCKTCGLSWASIIEDRCKGHGCPQCARTRSKQKRTIL